MDGFTIDPGQFGVMVGKVDEIGESLGAAANSFGAVQGVDLGHASLNAAAGQLMTGLGDQIGQFQQDMVGLGQSLRDTQQAYAGTDEAAAGALASTLTSGPSPSDGSTTIPYAGTGIGLRPGGGLGPILEQ